MKDNKEENQINEIKILLLGDSGVGKTSIFKKYTNNEFKGNYNSSIGVDFLTKIIEYKKKKYKLHIFDTAGQERFRSITKSYFNMGDFFFVVFDLTNQYSLNSIPIWVEQIKEVKENPTFIILGNKKDLKNKQMSDVEIYEVLEKINNNTFEVNDKNFLKVSAKDGKNINEAFELMFDLYELTVNNNQNIIENENEIKETKNKDNKKLKVKKSQKDESKRCC